MIIDTHAHYDDEQFNDDREALLNGFADAGIAKVINVGASWQGTLDSVRLAKQYANVYAAIGVHPDDVGSLPENAIDELRALAAEPKVVAIGEIGLDYHWMVEPADVQKYWFRQQLALARELDLPVSIHSRDAAADTMEIAKEAAELGTRGVMHCYSYSLEQSREYLAMGFYLGIGGVVTYKNGRKLKEVVKEAPLDRLLLETDCPYLSPTPHRGERNSSYFLTEVVREIAQLKEIDEAEVLRVTEENANKLFRF